MLLSLQRLDFSPGWFQSMVEATAQCGAECAESLFFSWAQIFFHSTTSSSLPSQDSCLFFCCLYSPFILHNFIADSFCRTCRTSWAYTRQDCSTLTFFRREESHQECGAVRLCMWSQLSSEQRNNGERGGLTVRSKTQRGQAFCRADLWNQEKNICSWWHLGASDISF